MARKDAMDPATQAADEPVVLACGLGRLGPYWLRAGLTPEVCERKTAQPQPARLHSLSLRITLGRLPSTTGDP